MSSIFELDWTNWVTILLAAIGVIVAVLGVLFTIASVVLGALAVFGYRDLKATVIEQAGLAAKDAAKKAVDDVIAGYPSRAEMVEEIYAKVEPQVRQRFESKFDISAAEEVLENTDAPATSSYSTRFAAVYPDDANLPPNDIPPEHEEGSHES